MKPNIVTLDDDFLELFDFKLIAINCHLKDYKLCWKLNIKLGMELNKAEKDIEVVAKKNTSVHSCFMYSNEDEYSAYYLVKNRSVGFILPEQPGVDYLFKIEGEANEQQILKKLLEIPEILTAYIVDVNKLASKENLIF